MRILYDTNIVVDVFLERGPFFRPAAQLFEATAQGSLGGLLGATTVTTIHYLIAKVQNRQQARQRVKQILHLFEVATVNRVVLEAALESDFADFEDAVLHEAGLRAGADGIVTRDGDGFATATIPVYTPPELVEMLRQ